MRLLKSCVGGPALREVRCRARAVKRGKSNNAMGLMAFNIGSFFVCLASLIYMLVRRRWEKTQSKLFIIIIITTMVAAISDIVAVALRTYATASAATFIGLNIAGHVYFITHTAMVPLFLLYVLSVCVATMRTDWRRNNLIGSLFYFSELLVITNPLTHWVFSYGADLSYIRDWGVYVLYIVGMLYFIMSIIELRRNWRALTVTKRRGLTYFFGMGIIGTIIQLVVPNAHVELFAESLAFLGVLMFVENEEDLLDSELGVYNRSALEMDLDMASNTGKKTYVIAVRVTNIDAFSHLGGLTYATQSITSMIAEYLKTLVPWYRIYRTAPARFVVFDVQMSQDRALEVAQQIAGRFKSSWRFRDIDVDLNAVVALACIPDDLSTTEDVFYLVDTPVPPISTKDVLTGKDLGYLMRRADVERAVQRGFEENGYEVYYQPICDINGVPYAAEALMRLHDKTLGDVSPFEFIEVAERLGLIEQIGEFALREVCDFMASGTPQRLGINHISVNLSVIQCMQVGFPAYADHVISSYGIDPGLISFEITESVAASSNEYLGRVMTQLKVSGHRFAMDDYGTGYSNMHSLVTLDFDVVKIDKSVLWDGEKSDMGLVILENSVRMLRSIGCEVLVEGVETDSQVRLLQNLGVDYLQGFLFAKPMPKDTFVSFVEQHRV